MIRANAVEVAKIYAAYCRIDGCGWAGTECASYQEANDQRQVHLDWHRRQEATQ